MRRTARAHSGPVMNLAAAIQTLLGEPIELLGTVSGGCINNAGQGITQSGRKIFIKSNPQSQPGMFSAEAAGLEALGKVPNGYHIPQVLGVSESPAFLVLEWIETGRESKESQDAMGRGLAAQHQVTQPNCGFPAGDNFIGSTPQPNPEQADWLTFYRDQRIGFQWELLRQKGRCSDALNQALDRFCRQIADYMTVDQEEHALLHGDLWSGNKLTDSDGCPVLIDPATYFGCREADLAMTELFGGFDRRFYDAYNEAFPLQPGYSKRRDLYNLYHLLNHANLFGGSYASQALDVLIRNT
ncbi:MAG TPA: fructosamine kinase family protein [Myxococcales bacterium]|nr:fructosamine kinase family protein [Myxococcales bacterium]